MSAAAKSIFYFSFYLLASGFALFFAPNAIITRLGMAPTSEPWIHLVGALTFILGIFFCYTAKREVRSFFFISLFGRGTFTLAIIALVLFWHAPIALLLFGAVDVVGLVWTVVALQRR